LRRRGPRPDQIQGDPHRIRRPEGRDLVTDHGALERVPAGRIQAVDVQRVAVRVHPPVGRDPRVGVQRRFQQPVEPARRRRLHLDHEAHVRRIGPHRTRGMRPEHRHVRHHVAARDLDTQPGTHPPTTRCGLPQGGDHAADHGFVFRPRRRADVQAAVHDLVPVTVLRKQMQIRLRPRPVRCRPPHRRTLAHQHRPPPSPRSVSLLTQRCFRQVSRQDGVRSARRVPRTPTHGGHGPRECAVSRLCSRPSRGHGEPVRRHHGLP
jgi:hypothetical protein